MTTTGTTPSIPTRFRENPASMTYYVLMSATVALSTYLTIIFAGLAGHTITWPLLKSLSPTTITSQLGTIGIALLVAALIWATPYVVGYFTSAPFSPSPHHNGLPKPELWGLWAVIPATATLAILWFNPLWTPLVPSLGATLTNTLPADIGNNAASFGFIVIPMAATYSLFTHDDLKNNTSEPKRISTQNPPTTPSTSTSDSTDTNPHPDDTIDASDIPGDVTRSGDNNDSDNADQTTERNTEKNTTHSTNPLSQYTYNWQQPPEITFSDVGGMESVKDELRRGIINPLRGDTEKYEEFGVSIPNLLFHGPPGTGKTYMAEALAGQLGYPYVKLSASDITSKWINESGENINTLFSEAAEIGDRYDYAVVFVDEIDALLADRGMNQQHSENKKVVDEFLNHLSETGSQNTLFIGATNHFDALDTAAIRTGRIDKKIHVGLPDLEARIGVLAAQLDSRPGDLPPKAELKVLAEQLDGASAADIAGVVDRASRRAVERGANEVAIEDLVKEVDTERSR